MHRADATAGCCPAVLVWRLLPSGPTTPVDADAIGFDGDGDVDLGAELAALVPLPVAGS